MREQDWTWGSEELQDKVEFAINYVRLTLRKDYPTLRTDWFGAIGIDPRHLAVWIMTDLDAERDVIIASDKLNSLIQDSLRQVNYPAEAISHICGTVESQETVDRDWDGKWHHRMK
ncbi:MAG TPA: hypothetical protein VFT40_10180 [Sphingomicrobium sp.]|nr:hypothetical protein [Sphingomicrobium sp.]